jgi:type I restriction enzyme S subunit
MKEGWTYKKLGELFPIVMGKTPPRNVSRYWDEKKETNNLWVSIADLSKYEGKEIHETKEHISDEGKQGIKQIPKGSLLVSFKLTLGKMAFAGEKLYTNEAIMSLQRRDDVDLVFLYYYFSFLDWNKIASGNEKVKGKTLNKKSLSEIPVAYIPLKDQHSIVARLDAAFAHIDALKANAEKQLAEARQLFQAELTECMRPKEGWDADTLIEVYNFIDYRGATPNKIQSGVPLVTAKNVKYGYIDYTIKDFISREEYETRKSRGVSKKGDILFTTEAPLGNVAIADLDEFSAGQRLITLQQYKKPKYTVVNEFYFYYMLSSFFQNRVKELATGATAQGIKAKLLKTVNVPIPPIEVQHQIVSRLDALSANIKKLEEMQRKTLAECDALKQAMLREVFE